jgi:two-component system CheB/CheR fusion protein
MTMSNNLPIVVGIGASAGGLEGFKTILSSIPIDTGMAFVVVQHLAPDHESLTPVILARCTPMNVIEIRNGMRVEHDHIYVLPPNKFLTYKDGILYLQPTPEEKGVRTTIDVFFCSLAEARKQHAIGMILSGTGNDGSAGCKAIKAHGGIVIVQDPTTTEFNSMPQNVISTGQADYVLSIDKICDLLINHRDRLVLGPERIIDLEGYDFELDDKDASNLILILNLLKTKTKDDFSAYKKPSIKRRIQRRIEANHLKSYSDYYHFLENHPSEADKLRKDLLIRMTNFFRNPKSFEALIGLIVPRLLADPEMPFRVWVPGCSTGEEAYSLSILLMEQCSLAKINKKLQIFATDIDEEALEIARKGIYSSTIQRDVSPDRLAEFFDKEGKNYIVKNEVRSNVLFIQHNLLRDIPFSKLDLISCRNLFIYLESEIQREIIKLFHFALGKSGYLFLGSSETISREDTLFETISKKEHIFKRISSSSGQKIASTVINPQRVSTTQIPSPQFLLPQSHRTFYERAKQQLLEEYVPASILINAQYEIMYLFGSTSQYLKVPEGSPSQNLLVMARGGLAGKIKKAVQALIESKKTYVIDSTYIEDNKEPYWVEFKASILKKTPGHDLFIVTLKETEKFQPSEPQEKGLKGNPLIKTLERELKDARAYLQNTIEDLKESNEDLKIYNEEIISVNEELQATNEEMETSKEELQSLNEELSVVNSQLQEKIEEQDKTNNDLVNLLRSTDIATIFLDHKLNLKRFTPEAVKMFNLRESDLGRPLKDITMRVIDPNLMTDTQKILEYNGSIEQEVETDEKNWYLRKCRAYKTAEGKTSGVIITFANVTHIKRLQLVAQENEQKLLEIFDTLPLSIAYVDRSLKYHFSNKLYWEWLGVTKDLLEHSLKSPESSKAYEAIKPQIKKVLSGQAVKFENKVVTSSNVLHYEEIVLIPDIMEDLESKGFYILIFDITDRQRAAIAFLKAVIDVSPDPMSVIDEHYRLVIVNKAFCEKSEKSEKELLGRTPLELYSKREASIVIKENKKTLENGFFLSKRHAFPAHKQELYVVQKIAFEGQNSERYLVCSYQNVTAVYNSKAKLQSMVRKLKIANEDLKNFAHICSHDLQEPARMVLSFSKLFSEHFKELIDEEGRKYLHYILDGSQRMQKMIESTLSYAKISNETHTMEPVNCEWLVIKILEELKPSIEEFNATITYDALPTITGDQFKLYQLFQNIISNALKFRNKHKPKIHIGSKPYKSGYTFFIRDNGIGLDMAFKGRLFKLFGRLNKSEDYPGVGIGLAICKKIVEDYGGKIWVESELGQGTTFYFNLPQKRGLEKNPQIIN